MDLLKTIKEKLKIRSPSLTALGYYNCQNCIHHDDCICVVCEEGATVVCMRQGKHVSRWGTCKHFKPMEGAIKCQ